jgi:uncharacterized membrane protein YhaH (DUF805 family)
MPHWISETLLRIVNTVPALFVAEDSPNFALVRVMFVLIFIVLIIYGIIVLQPFWSAVARRLRKASTTDHA